MEWLYNAARSGILRDAVVGRCEPCRRHLSRRSVTSRGQAETQADFFSDVDCS